jgi:proline racemase
MRPRSPQGTTLSEFSERADTEIGIGPAACDRSPTGVGARARFLNLHTPGGFEVYLRELN